MHGLEKLQFPVTSDGFNLKNLFGHEEIGILKQAFRDFPRNWLDKPSTIGECSGMCEALGNIVILFRFLLDQNFFE